MNNWLRHLFSLDSPVTRREYLRTGATLMAGKYVVDATAIRLVTGITWTPWDYLAPMISVRGEKVAAFPPALAIALLLWTLVFVWIGVSMTLRRAVDAGKSPWLALWFFFPLVNYLVMMYFASLASSPGAPVPKPGAESHRDQVRSALLGMLAGLVVALAGLGLSVYQFDTYGATLFLGIPVLASAITAYVFNRPGVRTQRVTDGVVLMTMLMIAGTILLFALEGAVCLAMALPAALALGLLGSRIGRRIALSGGSPISSVAVILFLPAGLLADRVAHPGSTTVEVVTTTDIAASPMAVWEKVVQFGEIPPPAEWYFRAGIAYPVHATIAGSGVGAIRRCSFSTGDFVEPITVWDPGKRLAFGVTSQPAPLQEWSPYSHVYAPHVNGFFVSERGEFRLIALPGGGTRLEGHTWYHHNIQPEMYWRMFSDPILHRIHGRVLAEVKREAESKPGTVPLAP